MWLKWLPWRLVVSRVARAHGFIDPMSLLGRLHRFAQPSEVAEPIELLRAGVVFHARGLINSRAIQHNLDWVWPMWVERQFDPRDPAFVPRAFSITHVNLTHRNWTAVGRPDLDWTPIVDPQGLLTPHHDGWSIDAWIAGDDGATLLPSRGRDACQGLDIDENLRVTTRTATEAGRLEHAVEVLDDEDGPCCLMRISAEGAGPGWLVVSVRPANPEGVSFVHSVERTDDRELRVNEDAVVRFDAAPARVCLSDYRRGDVFSHLHVTAAERRIECDVGLATAAALFRLQGDAPRTIAVRLPPPKDAAPRRFGAHAIGWDEALAGRCRLAAPDERVVRLFDTAVAGLVLHTPELPYPGPYTYRRFWFRDAAFMLAGLLAANLPHRVSRALGHFPEHQTPLGYFHSQEGEWDSNGEALWILERYRRHAGRPLSAELLQAARKGADWIVRKRLRDDLAERHAGLLPAGFSAEHLGPNDFYYWDDFWSIAGLRAAATLLEEAGDPARGEQWRREAARLDDAVARSLEHPDRDRRQPGIPASPYRRMDSGAIGSLAVGYPLQLWAPDDPRLLATADFLLEQCSVRGGFFQDMIHSGINPYLTLHLAQVLLRAGDAARAWKLVETVADLASPTGQWPEAIHPHTLGGCMGDGEHLWAAAEWVLMLRHVFVREEGDGLVLAAGVPEAWLEPGATLRLGPTPTAFGTVTVTIEPGDGRASVGWDAAWHDAAPPIEVRLAGTAAIRAPAGASSVDVARPGAAELTEARS